jgi:hypothetical protein
VPQLRQASATARGAAQSPQNFAPSRLSLPQLWHFIGIGPSRELFEQRLRVFQVGGVEAFGEPPVDVGEDLASFFFLALLLEETTQTRYGSELERLRATPSGGCGPSPRAKTERSSHGLLRSSTSATSVVPAFPSVRAEIVEARSPSSGTSARPSARSRTSPENLSRFSIAPSCHLLELSGKPGEGSLATSGSEEDEDR